MQLVAHDLDVRPLLLEQLLGRLRHLVAEGVVLPDDVDLLDLLVAQHRIDDGLQLHVAVGVEAEMPEAAPGVGEVGIHRGVIQEHDELVRIARVVLLDAVDQRRGHARAVALEDVVDAFVDGAVEQRQAFLWRELVVHRHDLELLPEDSAALVDAVGGESQLAQAVIAGGGHQAGERIDVDDLDLRARRGAGGEDRGQQPQERPGPFHAWSPRGGSAFRSTKRAPHSRRPW